jgi:hypothetical protein
MAKRNEVASYNTTFTPSFINIDQMAKEISKRGTHIQNTYGHDSIKTKDKPKVSTLASYSPDYRFKS